MIRNTALAVPVWELELVLAFIGPTVYVYGQTAADSMLVDQLSKHRAYLAWYSNDDEYDDDDEYDEEMCPCCCCTGECGY